jgi:aspartyl-tRNA(Asn)/glutamyl-tRNA(Gln) amidotransferase subunit C
MPVSTEEVKHIAALARLEFDDEDLKQVAGEMDRILDYMGQLNELDISGVEPMSHVHEQAGTMREDKVVVRVGRDEALSNAPDHDGEYFRVPKVID